MRLSRAVVLSIDRLGAAWLGPYGNTWIETPNFNRLAAESLLCETDVADSPDLAVACRAWWTGRHAMQPEKSDPTLPAMAPTADGQSVLITDDSGVAADLLANSFSRRVVGEWPAATTCA